MLVTFPFVISFDLDSGFRWWIQNSYHILFNVDSEHVTGKHIFDPFSHFFMVEAMKSLYFTTDFAGWTRPPKQSVA